jgi:hypothetical protein
MAYGALQLVRFGGEVIPLIVIPYLEMGLASVPLGFAMFGGTEQTLDAPPNFRGFRPAGAPSQPSIFGIERARRLMTRWTFEMCLGLSMTR